MLLLGALALVAAGLLLYGHDAARMAPEYSNLLWPVWVATLLPLMAVAGVLICGIRLTRLMDRGQAFSQSTVKEFARIKYLFAAAGALLLAPVLTIWTTGAPLHLSIVTLWGGATILSAFGMTSAAIMHHLFSHAVRLREENELTV